MSVLRFDETTQDWVVMAPSRRLRPHDGGARPAPAVRAESHDACPFCPGNEAFTPPEIASVRPGGPGAPWRVRVVPNKFPVLTIEESPLRRTDDWRFQSMGGCGAHEVIVESPEHSIVLAQQPIDQIQTVLQMLQARSLDLLRDPRFQTVVIFKNHGVEAGTSLAHPHWQLVATPVTPRLLRHKHLTATEHFDRTGTCLYCTLRERELEAGRRILAVDEHFVALLPYASHLPFETWIVPRFMQASFRSLSPSLLRPLARMMRDVLLKLYTGLENPAYNLTIDDVPRGDEDKEYFMWHIRILPHLTTTAGFELGSGMAINDVLPEDATRFLCAAEIAQTAA